MKNKNLFFLGAIVLLMNTAQVFSQTTATPSRSDVKTILWTYSVTDPTFYGGPMDAIVELEYSFFREVLGDKTFLGINIHYKSMEYTPKFGGYRYKMHEKLYTQDVLQSADSRGDDCFTNIILNRVSIHNLSVDGYPKKFGYNGAVHNIPELGEISKTQDLNNLSLNPVLSTCSSIGQQGSNCIGERITNFEKGIKNKSANNNTAGGSTNSNGTQNNASSQGNNNTQSGSSNSGSSANQQNATGKTNNTNANTSNSQTQSTGSTSENNNQSNSTGMPAANSSSNNNQSSSSNNNNNKQSGEITNMSEYVGMKGSKESIKVYQQNGRYYIKSQNGSTTETDKQYFDKIQTVSASNAQIASNNEQIRKQNDPLANYKEPTTNSYNNNPMTNSNSNSNSYTQAANAIGSALNQWGDQMAANRLANEQRQQKQREKAEIVAQDNKSKAVRWFKTELDKYLVAAENGDEKARMTLIFELRRYSSMLNTNIYYLLPKHEEWLFEAAKNNVNSTRNNKAEANFAKNNIGEHVIYTAYYNMNSYAKMGIDLKQGIVMLEESANSGSVDAMMILAKYYNRKGKLYGSNAEKAFYYFSEAAKKGSPTAMLHLGNIYRDQNTDIGGVKYKSVPKNNDLAFRWYSKSAACTTYKETAFRAFFNENGSRFEGAVYEELSTMFEKGLGVKKDKSIAEILKRAYYDFYDGDKKSYRIPSQTIYDDYLAPNLTPENTNRWGETENKTSSPLKSDNSNSTNNAINLLKSGNTNSANNTLNPLKTLFKSTKSDNANSATNTATPITETSTLDEKAECNKAKIDYKAGTISKEAYKAAIKKYSQYASYESLRLQKAFRDKEITRAEYTHAIKILLRK